MVCVFKVGVVLGYVFIRIVVKGFGDIFAMVYERFV